MPALKQYKILLMSLLLGFLSACGNDAPSNDGTDPSLTPPPGADGGKAWSSDPVSSDSPVDSAFFQNAKKNNSLKSLFQEAVQKKSFTTAKSLVGHGYNPAEDSDIIGFYLNKINYPAANRAKEPSDADKVAFLEYLLKQGAKASKDAKYQADYYKFILYKMPDLNEAVAKGLAEGLTDPNMILDAKEKTVECKTLLHHAVGKNKPQIIDALIDAGAQTIASKCPEREFPQHLLINLAKNDDIAPVVKALRKKAPIDWGVKDSTGKTVLHHAAKPFWIKSMKALEANISAADFDAVALMQDDKGNTPLHLLLDNYYAKTVSEEMKYLVKKLAVAKNINNVEGKSPTQMMLHILIGNSAGFEIARYLTLGTPL